MKKSRSINRALTLIIAFVFVSIGTIVKAQDKEKTLAGIPDNISKIVSVSCMPCHSSQGNSRSKGALNFEEWTKYTAEKQLDKASEIYKQVNKGGMPPKEARENNPKIIPTKEQIDTIKKWADSLKKK